MRPKGEIDGMRHFVFLTNVPQGQDFGGCERQLLEYFTKVDYTLSKVTVAVTKDVFTQRLEQLKRPVEVRAYPFVFEGGLVKRYWQMQHFLKSLSADGVVFIQNNFFKFRLGEFLAGWTTTKGNIYSLEVLAAPQPKKPVSRMHFKVIPGMALRWRIRMFATMLRGRLCKKVITCSEEVRRRTIQWYHYPERKVVSIYHGVDLEKFRPRPEIREKVRSELGISEDETAIICTARLSKQKCIDRLIRAFDIAATEIRNCRLFLVGDGPLRGELKELAAQRSSAGRICFLGYRTDVENLLAGSDIFVLASDNEGLACSVIEAMGTGLACVVTDAPGASEVISNGINGFLVDRSEEALADGLRRALVLTGPRRKEIAEAAIKLVRQKFDMEEGIRRALETMGIDSRTDRRGVNKFLEAVPDKDVYGLNLVYHKYRHHCGHSGYDRLTAYLHAGQTNGKASPWFGQLIPNRVVRSVIWRAKVGAYTKDRLLAELEIAGKLLGRRPEVFHFLYGEDAYCYSGFVPRGRGKKIVATFHQPPGYFERVIRRRNHLDKLDGVVLVSRSQSEYFNNIVNRPKVTFIPHGVDTDFFQPGMRDKKKRRCLFVGRWLRDFETLRDVVRIVGKTDKSIEFTIVTTAKCLNEVESLSDAEVMCGVAEDELLGLYQSSSLLVLPLTDCTANNTILEALSCGLPIVTTDMGGVKDYVDEGCAVLTERKNSAAMAQKLLELIDDKEQLGKMGRNARNRAMEFSWPVIAGKLAEFYQSLYV